MNNFAISSAGIGEALQKSASALSSANNTLDESIALITAGNTVVQNSDMVGTALKTVSLRLRSTSTEIQELGEDADGAVENVSTLRDLLLTLTNKKVDIQLDKDTYKSTYEIMLEMSKVWDDMNDMSQASALEAMFGKRQANIGASILQNMSEAESVLESSMNSAGSAMQEQEKFQEGIQYSLDRMKASLQELSSTTFDSSSIKFFVDFGNAIVNTTTAMGGLGNVAIALAVVYGTYKILLPILIKQMSALATANGAAAFTTIKQAKAQVGLNGTIALGTTAIWQNVAALKAWMASNPIGWVVLLAGAVLGLAAHINSLGKSFETIKQEWDDLNTEIDKVNNELETTSSRIDELLNKESLSIIEQDELKRLESTNVELERQNALLEKQKEFLDVDFAKGVYDKYVEEFAVKRALGQAVVPKVGIAIFEQNTLNVDLARYDELEDKKLRNIALTKKEEKEYKKLGEELSDTALRVKELSDEYPFDDEVKQNWLDMYDTINKVMNPALYKQEDFEKIFNSEEFEKARNELLAYAEAGKLSPEILYYNKQYNELLSETGLTADEAASHINSMIEVIEDGEDPLSAFGDSFDKLNESLDELDKKSKDTVSSIKELNQVIYDQSQGTKLTSEQAYKLASQYPQLASALQKTTDGYIINEDAINDVREALINQEKANASAQLKMTRDTLNAVSDRVKAYGIEIEAITSIQAAMKEQSKLSLNSIFGDMDAWAFDDKTKRVTTPTGSYIANSTENEYDATKKAYQEQKLIYDTVGKMGNLQERINGLQNSLLSDKSFGVNAKSSSSSGKSTDPIKEAFDKKKNDIDHLLAMDKITQGDYYNRLEKLNNQYFGKNKKTHLQDYRKYLEEVTKGRKKLNSDAIKSLFDDLAHNYAMGKGGLKTEEDYQTARWELAKKYYKNNKDYMSEWRTAQEEWYKWNLTETEKTVTENEKKRVESINKIIGKYEELRDTINRIADNQLGDKQIKTYSEGISYINKEIKYLEKEIKKLNKKKITPLFTKEDYDSQLQTLQSALTNARSAIDDFNKSIAESIKVGSEDVMSAIEDGFDGMSKYWENEKSSYDVIIKAQKDIIRLKKEQDNYEKSIAKKTREVSKIESRMAELQKAAMTGDRQANAELQKLEEELADKKEDLSETQADREDVLANEALDKALEDNNKIIDAKLDNVKKEYEAQRDTQQKLYDQLIDLTSKASNFTVEAYGKAIDDIASKMKANGVVLGTDSIKSLKSTQEQAYNNADSIHAILGNQSSANKSKDVSSLSGLNKYLASQGYGVANKDKMVQLAQALGLYNISSPDMVGTDQLGRANKNLIMEELKRLFAGSTFAKGGIASLPKMMGEDGFALIKNGEPVLTVEQGKLFKELVSNIKPLNNLVKLNTPNLSGVVNNSSPTVQIDSLISVSGNVDSNTVPKIQAAGNDVIKKLVDIMKTK